MYRPLNHIVNQYNVKNYSLKQYYSTFHPASAWDTAPLVDIHKFVQGIETNMPKDANFSILHPNNITRSLQEIREIYSAIGISGHPIDTKSAERQLKNLIVLRPQRLLLHEIIIQLTTQIQLENDEHFMVLVKALERESLAQINDKKSEFEKLLRYYNELATDMIETHEFDGSSISGETIKAIFETVSSRVKKRGYILGNYTVHETVKSVVSKILADDLLRKHYVIHVNDIVSSHITTRLKRGADSQGVRASARGYHAPG